MIKNFLDGQTSYNLYRTSKRNVIKNQDRGHKGDVSRKNGMYIYLGRTTVQKIGLPNKESKKE